VAGGYPPGVRAFALAILVAVLAGCADLGPAAAEPFSRDRLGQVARSLESARDAGVSAHDHLLKSLEETEPGALSGLSPDAAFDLTRRALLRSKNRIDSAQTRLGTARERGRELFEAWDKHLSNYEDPDLRRAAEKNIEAVRGRHRACMRALASAWESLAPVHRELSDRMLAVMHHRDQPTATPPERSGESLDRAGTVVQAMRDKVRAADEAVEEFLRSIHRSARARP
jgi:hypothetical protein